MQSRLHSLIEQLLNIGSGFLISLCVWEFIVKPIWKIETNFAENLQITILFTVVSLARSYTWRRVFNHFSHKNNKKKSYGNNERILSPEGDKPTTTTQALGAGG
jgi:hypothetical protein